MVAVKVPCWFGKLNTGGYHVPFVPRLLTAAEIEGRLKELRGWKAKGGFITKTYEFDHFMDAIAFVNEVAEAAERQEHHPDINVRYTTVTLSIQTHSEGGVTKWDIDLAKTIDILEDAVQSKS